METRCSVSSTVTSACWAPPPGTISKWRTLVEGTAGDAPRVPGDWRSHRSISAGVATKEIRKARVNIEPWVEMTRCCADGGNGASRPHVRVQRIAELRLREE